MNIHQKRKDLIDTCNTWRWVMIFIICVIQWSFIIALHVMLVSKFLSDTFIFYCVYVVTQALIIISITGILGKISDKEHGPFVNVHRGGVIQYYVTEKTPIYLLGDCLREGTSFIKPEEPYRTIESGGMVWVSVYQLHYDKKSAIVIVDGTECICDNRYLEMI